MDQWLMSAFYSDFVGSKSRSGLFEVLTRMSVCLTLLIKLSSFQILRQNFTKTNNNRDNKWNKLVMCIACSFPDQWVHALTVTGDDVHNFWTNNISLIFLTRVYGHFQIRMQELQFKWNVLETKKFILRNHQCFFCEKNIWWHKYIYHLLIKNS